MVYNFNDDDADDGSFFSVDSFQPTETYLPRSAAMYLWHAEMLGDHG